jgi:hypothetical protein
MNNYTSTTEIPIIKKLYDLYKTYYDYQTLFSKRDKYALGSKCEQYIFSTFELILAASSAAKQNKMTLIQQANVKFDTLKVLFRLAKDLKMLDIKKYTVIQGYLQEIGRMLGGWQRSLI